MDTETIVFNVEKYNSDFREIDDQHLLCSIRKISIKNNHEEKVRQSLINFLINDMGVDPNMIEVEVNLSIFSIGCNDRADIIVYGQGKRKNVPVLLVECKAGYISINDDVWEQADRYNQHVKAPFILITNGFNYEFYSYNKKKKEYNLLAGIPSYDQLITSQGLIYDKTESWERPDFENIHSQEAINDFVEDFHIGNYTLKHNPKLIPFIVNFGGFLYDHRIIKTKNIGSIKLIEDLGVMHRGFGNSSGGNFDGYYRSFLLENKVIVHMGILAQADENTLGKSILIVAIDDGIRPHNSLQLSLDKFSDINKNKITISHNGKLTCGNLGAVPCMKVINFVKNQETELLNRNQNEVLLGSFDLLNEITWESQPTELFIERLIKYALLRDKFRKLYSEGKL